MDSQRDQLQMAAAETLKALQASAGQQLSKDAIEECFERCVPTVPSGGKLDHSKTMCMSACVGAYFNTFMITSEAMKEKMEDMARASSAGGGSSSGW